MVKLLATLLILGSPLAGQAPSQGAQAAALEDFNQRLGAYVKLAQTAESSLKPLKPTPSPEAITHHEHELAERIQRARHNARQGDIFTPSIAAEFRRLMGYALKGNNSDHIAKSLKNAEPVTVHLHVNGRYPHPVPLQSTPPTILMNLPVLPKGLEYRVNGHQLVLLDVRANLVVDILPDTVP